MDKKNIELSLYPIVIRQSRYAGVYEGGLWFAIPNHEETGLSDDYVRYIHGDDCDSFDFWSYDITKLYGIGNTPDEALQNLISKHSAAESETTYKDIRDSFTEHVEARKEHFTQRLSDIMNIHIERTDYFEQSSGFNTASNQQRNDNI